MNLSRMSIPRTGLSIFQIENASGKYDLVFGTRQVIPKSFLLSRSRVFLYTEMSIILLKSFENDTAIQIRKRDG